MRDNALTSSGEIAPDVIKTAGIGFDNASVLDDGLAELYLDMETVWTIQRDSFGVTDAYLFTHMEAALPILKSPAEGILLYCEACGRPSSFGPAGIRKSCYYCGEPLMNPQKDTISDVKPLFIPPIFGMAGVDILKESISASYTHNYGVTPSRTSTEQNTSEKTRIDYKAQQLLNICRSLEDRYRLVFPILLAMTDLIREKLSISPTDFVAALLTRPDEVRRYETCFQYPYALLSVLWRYVTFASDATEERYQEEKNRIHSIHSMPGVRDETPKILCSGCGRETSTRGSIFCKCPYCGQRLRETTLADVFPNKL